MTNTGCPNSPQRTRAIRALWGEATMEPAAAPPKAEARTVVALLSRLRSAKGQADPYPIYSDLRSLGSVIPSPWNGMLLTTYAACKQVLHDRGWLTLDAQWRASQGERWSSRTASQEFAGMLIALNAPAHTQQRHMLGTVFGRATLTQLQSTIEQLVNECLDSLAERSHDGHVDFAASVGEELPVRTIGHWLGIPRSDHTRLRELTHHVAYAQELFPTAAQLDQADAAALELKKFFTALVQDRRRAPRSDVLTAWLQNWDALEPDRAVANETVRRLATFFLMAGLETTSTLLNSAVWLLTQHSKQTAWLHKNPQAFPDAVEECLRYDAPVQLCSRVAGRDLTIDGIPVPKGTRVYGLLGAAHHDPSSTPDPDTFDIRRRGPVRHLAFSGGPHYCVGAGLARLECTVLLQALLKRFPHMQAAGQPTWEPRVAFRRITALPISVA